MQGINTLQFQESNAYSTKFEWTLYIDQGAIPEEYVSSSTYDSYGNIISITDALGNTMYFGYDLHHLYLTSVTNALNETVSATYDFSTGLVTSITDANGNTSHFEYDILGRVTKRVNPDLTKAEAFYDDQNNSVTIHDELDHSTTRYYDGIGRLVRTEWYVSPTLHLEEICTYNYQNKVVTRQDPGGHVYTCEYDSLARPIRIYNPDSTYRQVHYDDTANTVLLIDENQHKAEYHYNWTGQLLWVKEYTDPGNYYLTQYTYDSSGNLTSFTDARGNTTFYEYDSLYGVTSVTYPDLTTETFSYDAAGNVLSRTDSHGTTQFVYDAISRLLSVQYPDQTSVTFSYDSNSNRTSMTDSEGATSCIYDDRNRLISETRLIEGEFYTTTYAYDAVSNIISMIYPDQSVITLDYDSLNQLTAIPGYAQFTYDTDSLLSSVTYANGVVTEYQYDCMIVTTDLQ